MGKNKKTHCNCCCCCCCGEGTTPQIPVPPSIPEPTICQSEADIREFFRTSLNGAPIRYTSVINRSTIQRARFSRYNAAAGEVILFDAIGDFTLTIDNFCTVTTDI